MTALALAPSPTSPTFPPSPTTSSSTHSHSAHSRSATVNSTQSLINQSQSSFSSSAVHLPYQLAPDTSNTLPPRSRARLVRQGHKLNRLLGETVHFELPALITTPPPVSYSGPVPSNAAAQQQQQIHPSRSFTPVASRPPTSRRNTLTSFPFALPSPPLAPESHPEGQGLRERPTNLPSPPLGPPTLTLTSIPHIPSPPNSAPSSPSSIRFPLHSDGFEGDAPLSPEQASRDPDYLAREERRRSRARLAKVSRLTGENVPAALVLGPVPRPSNAAAFQPAKHLPLPPPTASQARRGSTGPDAFAPRAFSMDTARPKGLQLHLPVPSVGAGIGKAVGHVRSRSAFESAAAAERDDESPLARERKEWEGKAKRVNAATLCGERTPSPTPHFISITGPSPSTTSVPPSQDVPFCPIHNPSPRPASLHSLLSLSSTITPHPPSEEESNTRRTAKLSKFFGVPAENLPPSSGGPGSITPSASPPPLTTIEMREHRRVATLPNPRPTAPTSISRARSASAHLPLPLSSTNPPPPTSFHHPIPEEDTDTASLHGLRVELTTTTTGPPTRLVRRGTGQAVRVRGRLSGLDRGDFEVVMDRLRRIK